MKRRISFFTVGVVWSSPVFLFLTVLFICGAIAGGFTGLLGEENDAVTRLASYLVSSAQAESFTRQLAGALVSAAAWPVACMAAGLFTPPSLLIGAVVAARGFSLSFTVSAMAAQLGMRGLLLSLAAAGLAAIITVPCLLVIAAAVFLAAGDAPRGKRSGYLYALGRYRGALALCFLLSIGAAVLRAAAAPLLLGRLG